MNRHYDIIHFEALGAEAHHLTEETERAKEQGLLPDTLRTLVIPETIQEFQKNNPDEELPDIITIKTHSVIPDAWLSGCKKSIITRSAGYDHVEALAGKANITSLRNYCVNSVAQTAVKFVYATAGLLNHYTNNAILFERSKALSFMELCPTRTATVFGLGKIGRRIYELLEANGLDVQAVDIREQELKCQDGGAIRFVSKETAIETSDIIVNAMNLTKLPDSAFYNVNYFSEEYLSRGKAGFLFINITRGEIAPETGLLHLYEKGLLGGIGLDVFSSEQEFSDLLKFGAESKNADVQAARRLVEMAKNRTANINVQPHQAFNSDLAACAKAADTIRHLIRWFHNQKQRFDEQLPYYGNTVVSAQAG